MNARYPVQTIVLADGKRVRVRPIRPGDAARLQAFVARCSPRTIFLRANMVRPTTLSDSEAAYLTRVDYRSSMALVALTGVEPYDHIVAVARYAGSEPAGGEAEAAIMVEDAYHQCGLGSQLLARLVAYARQQGFSSLVGNISAHNEPVLAMIRRTGLTAEYLSLSYGECQVIVSLAQRTPHSVRPAGNLPARAFGRVGRSFQWHLSLATKLVLLLRQM